MAWLLVLPPSTAAVLAVACALVRRPARPRSYAPVLTSAVVLGSGVALCVEAVAGVSTPTALGGLLRGDALSAFLLAVVGAVGLIATWGGLPRRTEPPIGRRFAALLCLFLGAMSLAVVADNLGILWVAIEATTITTAFLVGDDGNRRAVEAAWKYVVLGSVGVAIAFLGIVLLYAATLPTGSPTLSWTALAQAPAGMDPALVRVAVALAVLGFATKAGLAPMHSWLPDAHSQAPAQVSALMSGVLLSVAFYAILRVQAVADAVVGPGLARGMLVTAALLSLGVSAALLVRQRDLKRLLAYSSLEHMGVLALAAAIGGPLAISAALLHVLCHGLAKSATFVSAGRIARVEGTTSLADLRGLVARRPGLAIPFVVGVVALLGFPPFGLFFSEVAIVLAGVREGLVWPTAVAVALLLVVVAAIARHVLAILSGPGADSTDHAAHGTRAPLAVALAVAGVGGFLGGSFAATLAAAALAVAS